MCLGKFTRLGTMAVVLRRTKTYEPKPRYSHYAASSGDKGRSFVFAGMTAAGHSTVKAKKEFLFHIEVFDHYFEQWKSVKTTGSPPKGQYAGACCVSPCGDLFAYGGDDGQALCGGLHKLSYLMWSQLSVESDAKGPMKKVGCALICFTKTKIAVIGGYGLPHGTPQPGSSFVKDKSSTDGRGWTNEIHTFDSEECKSSQYIFFCEEGTYEKH